VASVPKPEPASNNVKPTTTAPVTNHVVEPVRVPAEPIVRTAPPVSIASAAPSSNPAADTGERAGAIQRSTPSNSTHKENVSASNPAVNLAQLEMALGTNTYPRYRYRPLASPAAGNRSAAEPVYSMAVKAQQASRFNDAIQYYQHAIQLDPAYYDAYYNLGLAETSLASLPQALAAYEGALAIQPDSRDARYNFALVLKQAGYVIDSVNELERLLVTYPNEARAHLTLGNLYASLRQPARAREHYVKVLEIDPRNPQAPNIRDWLVANPR
jgi:tetratricopeptide (TPR) repeat protein